MGYRDFLLKVKGGVVSDSIDKCIEAILKLAGGNEVDEKYIYTEIEKSNEKDVIGALSTVLSMKRKGRELVACRLRKIWLESDPEYLMSVGDALSAIGLYGRAQRWYGRAEKKGGGWAYTKLFSRSIKVLDRKFFEMGVAREDREVILEVMYGLNAAVLNIRERHAADVIFERPSIRLAHYTKLKTLENILPLPKESNSVGGHVNDLGRMRRYHVSRMNDPTEGLRLLKVHTHSSDVHSNNATICSKLLDELFEEFYFNVHKKNIDVDFDSQDSIYIACLSELGDEDESLNLWRFYGDDGRGACISMWYPTSGMSNLDASVSGECSNLIKEGLPRLYKVLYEKKDIEKTLEQLYRPFCKIYDISSVYPKCAEVIKVTAVDILLGLLFLYKDENYASEREWRTIRARPLSDKAIMLCNATGGLYDETPPFLFSCGSTNIILGPKVEKVQEAFWNTRFRLSRNNLGHVAVLYSKMPYR